MEYLYLEYPIHPNSFPEFKIPEENIGDFMFSIEGGIQAVKESVVQSLLSDKEILEYRVGYKPVPRKMKVTNMEELLRLVAILVEL